MDLTPSQVGAALAHLGNYRVKRAQHIAGHGTISGALVLALGLRETGLRNIQGGARLVNGAWVAEDRVDHMDVGFAQINRSFHRVDLARMPGVATGTWAPVVPGKTAADGGFVPRFEEQLAFVVRELHEAVAFAADHGISGDADQARFAVAAHNAGLGGALSGYRAGDVDRHTAHADYSAWCLRHRDLVSWWLRGHAGWVA